MSFKVLVKCFTYNHSKYILDALNGFTSQITDFPYVVTIVDDASTDGNQEVIVDFYMSHFAANDKSIARDEEKDYGHVYFARHNENTNCYFAIILLKENHYSKIPKIPKAPYIQEWVDQAHYIALCEGDDYWTDPNKLKKQISILDANPEYTMTCNRVKLFSVRKDSFIGEDYCYEYDSTVKLKDVIYRTGLFISTCSIVYRKSLTDNYPRYCRKCAVGDYPLQIMAAIKGKIYYFNAIMCVYRIDNPESWIGKQEWIVADERRIRKIRSRINMLHGFSNDYPQYKRYFRNKIADEIRRNLPWKLSHNREYLNFVSEFSHEISHLSLPWKIDFILRTTELPIIKWYHFKSKTWFSRFCMKRLYYPK